MSDFTGVQWQPISQLPVFEQLVGGMLAETLAFHGTLAKAVDRPQALDDATLNYVQRQYLKRAESTFMRNSSGAGGRRDSTQRRSRRWTELSDLELGPMTVLSLIPAEFKKQKQQG